MTTFARYTYGLLGAVCVVALACTESKGGKSSDPDDTADSAEKSVKTPEPGPKVTADQDRVDTRPPPMAQPVPLWKDGKSSRKVDAATAGLHGYIVMDLGEEWTPYIFTERGTEDEEKVPNAYRDTYLKLAREEFPDNHHGKRARKDKYLELYGIMPTLSVLRERFQRVADRECTKDINLEPLKEFDGLIVYKGNSKARWRKRHFDYLETHIKRIRKKQDVSKTSAIDAKKLGTRDRRRLREYRRMQPQMAAIRATQKRLECMGYFEGKGDYTLGAMDWATHEALSEFEHRNRIYSWGYIGNKTLDKLRHMPMELERQTLVRVLTERAMHAAGVIEDGSMSTLSNGEPRTFTGADGKEHPIPDLENKLRKAVVKAFGLQEPKDALEWLRSLGELPPKEERLVAFPGPERPEYYDGNMELMAVIDRGDVWYEFPYTNEGEQRRQPRSRRPKLTLYVKYLDQQIPLARYGTTIGGWRSEKVDGEVMWKYKNSPTGPRVWHEIVASPVWLPPESTPAADLLKVDHEEPKDTRERYEVNYHETGPSYASAYGLVAAYHQKYRPLSDGGVDLAGDEGIRTHGSVDYMSIMRRHSHGCHRLHNHLAVRLMSFVLAHRPHRRVGQQDVHYTLNLEHEDYEYMLELDKGGYVFELEKPMKVYVREGRVKGELEKPITHAIPKYHEDAGAFVLKDGGAVKVNRFGEMTRFELKRGKDGGVDGGADAGVGLASSETKDGGTTVSSSGTLVLE